MVALLALVGGQARAEPVMQVWSGKGTVTQGGTTLATFAHLSLLRLPNGRLMVSNMDGPTIYAIGGHPPAAHPAREYEYPADHVQLGENAKGADGVQEMAASGRCRMVYLPTRALLSADCQTDTERGVYDIHFNGDHKPAWTPPHQTVGKSGGHGG